MLPLETKEQRCVKLKDEKFQSLPSIEREGDGNEEEKQEPGRYDYLLSIPIKSFTHEKMEELNKEILAEKEKIHKLHNSHVKPLWLNHLEALEDQLDDVRNETLSLLIFNNVIHDK